MILELLFVAVLIAGVVYAFKHYNGKAKLAELEAWASAEYAKHTKLEAAVKTELLALENKAANVEAVAVADVKAAITKIKGLF